MAPRGKPSRKSPAAPLGLRRLDPKEGKSAVQSLAKGLRVLEAFSGGADEMTLSEVAAASGLDAGTTFRLLNTLVEVGYVLRVTDSRRFRLTLKVLDLGFNAIAHQDLRALVRPLLQSLVDRSARPRASAVLEGGDMLYIERVRAGFTRLGVDIRIGTTIHAPVTSIGRTILAFLPESRLERASPPRHATRCCPCRCRPRGAGRDVGQVRKDGYIVQESTITPELRLLAVPVLDADGHAIGAISVVAPTIRPPRRS